MSNTAENLKQVVRDAYSKIATLPRDESTTACCGSGPCSGVQSSFMMAGEDYATMPGYNPDADLGLGCGIPTQFSGIRTGDTVVDLGSGAGNDAFIARAQTGEPGRVIGVDMTPAMLEKARSNNAKLGFENVDFVRGEIEDLPLKDAIADVVLSNCVLNLVPDKTKAFAEIYRVLKPGGHFTISDIVLDGQLPEELRKAAELYAGCVSGAMQKREYLGLIVERGFQGISLLKEKNITIPDDILATYLTPEQLSEFHALDMGIKSITVTATRPASKPNNVFPWMKASQAAPDQKAASSCCGGPPKTNEDACCVKDEEAKASGSSGCGCS
ncbi:MAG: arsenite methyltransferase [Leptospirales bacterium]|nr:arsenite methyltransferase [Leptospirales bacterium]